MTNDNENAPSGVKDTCNGLEMENPDPAFDLSRCGEQPPAPPEPEEDFHLRRMKELEKFAEWLQLVDFPKDSGYTATVLGFQGAMLTNIFGLLMGEALKDTSLSKLRRYLTLALRTESQSRQTLQLLEKIRTIVKKENAKSSKELKKRLEKRERDAYSMHIPFLTGDE